MIQWIKNFFKKEEQKEIINEDEGGIFQPFQWNTIYDNPPLAISREIAVQINGVLFEDEEKVRVQYLNDNWQTATIYYRKYGRYGEGWHIYDYWCDYRPLSQIKGIKKII